MRAQGLTVKVSVTEGLHAALIIEDAEAPAPTPTPTPAPAADPADKEDPADKHPLIIGAVQLWNHQFKDIVRLMEFTAEGTLGRLPMKMQADMQEQREGREKLFTEVKAAGKFTPGMVVRDRVLRVEELPIAKGGGKGCYNSQAQQSPCLAPMSTVLRLTPA